MAVGITIKPEKIQEFIYEFELYARDNLNYEDVVAKLEIDALTSLDVFNIDTVKQLQMLEPFGQGNPRPLFATKGVHLAGHPRRVGAKADHLQLTITDNKAAIRCIGFGMGKLEKKLLEKDFFNVAYYPQLNTYNGNTNVQLQLEDIQFD